MSCHPHSVVVGAGVPCFFHIKELLRLVGLEQEVEGPHLRVVAVAVAAVEGDTCH